MDNMRPPVFSSHAHGPVTPPLPCVTTSCRIYTAPTTGGQHGMGAHCGGAFVGSTFGPVPIVPGTTGFDRAMPSHTPQYVFPSDSQTACRLQRPLPSWIDGFPPTAVPEPIVSPSASTTPPEFVGSAGSHDGVCNVHKNPRNITNRAKRNGKRRNFSCTQCTSILEAAIQKSLYPSQEEKRALCASTGMDQRQINNWFCNYRRKMKR